MINQYRPSAAKLQKIPTIPPQLMLKVLMIDMDSRLRD